jgi:hypothetical protein
MPLVDIHMASVAVPIPCDITRLLAEAERRIVRFQAEYVVPGFVASNYVAAFGVLQTLADSNLSRGSQFCEWGSGLGVVTCLAAMLGFDACGIEVEESLVSEARQLAEDFGLSVEFVHGSFVPRGAEDRVHACGTYSWLTTEGDYAYEELGLDPTDMDVVFAYPWPDEEGVTGELFERYAGYGGVLATYHGGDEFRLRRKSRRRVGRRHR